MSQTVTPHNMNDLFSLPGVKSISYIPASSLADKLGVQALAGLPIYIHATPTPIEFNGDPTCECTHSNAGVSPSQSLEFSFRSTQQIPDDRYLAFLDHSYLIGTKEEHPLIERVQSFGNPDSDSSTFTYTIQLTSPRALIPCSIL